jgi:acyl carrier protein
MNNNSKYDIISTLVINASNGAVSMEELEKAGGSLLLLSYNSVAYVNLIVLLEEQFGISIDPDIDPDQLTSIDKINQFVISKLY